MNKITAFSIINIKLEGFKQFKEPYEVGMDTLTYISGGNGQGKTSIADAIAYVFCGTPFMGEKSCEKLQNPDCREMKVDVQLVDQDGEIHTLSRRKSGNTTTITMDTLQLRQTDIVSIFAEKDVFLSLFNPLYFIEKIAEDGREFLQKLLPPVNENEVLELLSENTKELLDGESLLDPEFYTKKKREELKEITDTATYLDGQLDLLKKQQLETVSKVDAAVKRGEEIVSRKTQLEGKQYSGIDVDALKEQQARIAEGLSENKRAKLLAKQAEARNRQYISKFTDELAKIKTELASLSALYKKLDGQIRDAKIGDKCPTCHTVVTEANYEGIVTGMKRELASVCNKGKSVQSAYQELLEFEKKSMQKFAEFRDDDLAKLEAELAQLGNGEIGDIAMLEDKIRLGNLSEEEFSELTELRKQADAYAKEVELLCEADKIPEKITAIEKSLADNKKRSADIQSLIHAAGEFAAKKAEITLSQLKMNCAAIKLLDVVKTTGEIKNVFRFTYDGKDYRWISTSERLKAGLEVSKLLQRLTGLVYPTYIDNAECITTKLEQVNGQVILAYAKNCPLTVQLPRRSQAQVKEAA